jgi:hypothetical protein
MMPLGWRKTRPSWRGKAQSTCRSPTAKPCSSAWLPKSQPSPLRTTLWAPSQPRSQPTRSVSVSPLGWSKVPVTPSSSWSRWRTSLTCSA